MELLDNGIYIVWWKTGGCSVASVYVDRSGEKWIAPSNWVGPGKLKGCINEIFTVEQVGIKNKKEDETILELKKIPAQRKDVCFGCFVYDKKISGIWYKYVETYCGICGEEIYVLDTKKGE